MNALSPSTGSTAVAALSKLKSDLRNVVSTIPARGGEPILRLLKDGSWVYGQDNVEVQDGSLWAVNPLSIRHGFVSWNDDATIVGELMVPMGEPLPPRASLSETGFDWDQQLSCQLRCMSGEDIGTQTIYKVTSKGGLGALERLITALAMQIDADPEHPVPLVELTHDSYQHKKYGKVYVPVFEVRKWASLDGDGSNAAAQVAVAQAEAPAEPKQQQRRTRRASVPAAGTAEQRVADDTAHAERMNPAPVTAAVDPAELRRQELLAQLAALDAAKNPAPAGTAAAEQPEPGQPVRRRRA